MKTVAPLRLLIAGHVDHGKSTLVGRLLYETGSLSKGKLAAAEASCKKRGVAFEWAFITDALQAERDQNVTIDTAHTILKTKKRDVILIDAPGHREFLRNLATGAGAADAALLMVDAKQGIGEQTYTHAALLRLLGVKRVIVVINKMDAVGYKQKIFSALTKELKKLALTPLHIIPISARDGENLIKKSTQMAWYKGPNLLAAIAVLNPSKPAENQPLRLPVQDVYKQGDKRILVGRIESGSLKTGDTVLFSPAGSKAKIDSIEIWNKKTRKAKTGESIGITLDTPLFIERGQVASHEKDAPLITNFFPAKIMWFGKSALTSGSYLTLKIGTQETEAEIRCKTPVAYGDIAEITLRTRGQIAVDGEALSRFVLAQDNEIRGGGVVITDGLQHTLATPKSKNIATEEFGITPDMRAKKNGHKGGVLWFTGLPGSGKSTIARHAQKKLFDKNYQVFVLDGDNIRQGLNRDLGFTAKERKENIRRVAEVAALFAKSGTIAIAAFISPYEEDRENARAVSSEPFHVIHIKATLKTCKARDPKGHYKKARAGKIAQFTGVSAPYEAPKNADLVLDTEAISADACAEALVAYITRHLIEKQT
jgi:bifunctional enzyme CysN/CysC